MKDLIARRLRTARIACDKSQADVAAALEVSVKTVGNWERGEVVPPADAIAGYARLSRLSADYLLGLSDHPTGLQPGSWIVDLDAARQSDDPRKLKGWAYLVPQRPRVAKTEREARRMAVSEREEAVPQ